jgi:ATP-binding cassette subfamily F protein 3
MIQVFNLSKSFGTQKLLDSVSFSINPRERIGLTGRNGHGKTTLLRIIIGEDYPDEGEIAIPKNYTIGYVSQHIGFTCPTLIDEACSGLPDHLKDERWNVEKILSGLGFSKDDMDRSPSEFSGGYQVRLNLAKIIASAPDMLLLDEPTNYLDIVSIRWLSGFLRQWPGEIMLVTHDRSFMDAVTTHTLGIHRKKMRKIEGGTDKLYEQIIKEEEIHEKTRLNDEKKRKEMELFISRFRAKARLAGMVQSRVKTLQKMDRIDRLEMTRNLDFEFAEKEFTAKTIMETHGLTFGYDKDAPLIKDFSISVRRGDRICVIGKNGKGKSTLLRLLAGELKPDTGSISYHTAALKGYYAQTNTINLNPNLSIEAELMSAGCEKQRARDIAGAMMFEGDNALKPIQVLSGGEKSRVLFGKILANPSNILFLDEPTNHLDMESCDTLMGAVEKFSGAVVLVTHNELFLHNIPDKLIVFSESGAHVFHGTYADFLAREGWEDETAEAAASAAAASIDSITSPINKKENRKLRADITTRRSKALKPVEQAVAAAERDIETAEKECASLTDEIATASMNGAGAIIGELSKKLASARSRTEALYEKYETLLSEQERLTSEFDAELEAIS